MMINYRQYCFIVIALFNIVSPVIVLGQEKQITIFDKDFPNYLEIKTGEMIRLDTRTHKIKTGLYLGCNIDSLFIKNNYEVEYIALNEINKIWVRDNSMIRGFKRGALGGAITGCIVVPLFMKAMSLGADEGGSYTTEKFLCHFGIGVVVGATVGSLIGYGLGTFIPYWDLRFNRSLSR